MESPQTDPTLGRAVTSPRNGRFWECGHAWERSRSWAWRLARRNPSAR
jgi:hypothetical protein